VRPAGRHRHNPGSSAKARHSYISYFDPGDPSYRFVNFDSHAYEFRCCADRISDSTRVQNPAGPSRWPFSTTFAAPDRVAADRFGQPGPQRLPELRNGLPHNAFRCPCRAKGILKGTEANLTARRAGSGRTVVLTPAIRAQSAALFNTRKIGYSRILTLCLTYDYEGLGGD
jgi:hypothetical protein